MSVFGWVANLGPGFLEPILICLVVCIEAGAWLRLAKSIPLAWLQENDQIGDSILARLGLALMLVPLTAWLVCIYFVEKDFRNFHVMVQYMLLKKLSDQCMQTS